MRLKPSQGVALIEAALALLLLSSGVLLMLWWIHQGLTITHQQHWRQVAMNLADDMAQRMQLNASQAVAYQRCWGTRPATSSSDCTRQPCSGATLASWDMQQWQQHLDELPQGDACITPLTTRAGGWWVQVAWRDGRESHRPQASQGAQPCPAGQSCWQLWVPP